MTEHDRGHEHEAQHETEPGTQPETGAQDEARGATYAEQRTGPGRSFPLLAPIVMVVTAGIILLLWLLFGGR